ncbi:RagB/SusD family nutrient uptake outer membrane protein [uncultured Formosa sp.]|uniref:RagB/SusD family nutrient uptake outer membrane protein n=1 Tax=uncultured Formosa sp. TaxID=255435 RepID=UPI00261EA9E8|nr:RagB/SusD family nutrient uptake outer membrane protein [uncultured Formosa sp.]
MKNIFISLVVMGLLFTSCSDFLEEDVRSNVVAEEYYETSAGYESLINANYSMLSDIYGKEPWTFCAGTDMYSDGRTQQPVGISRYLTLSAGTPEIEPLYENAFSAIQIANMGLYYNEITDYSDDLEQYKGELKYLRANAYFLLVQTYGGVSLVTDYINSPILSFSRNSEDEIYSFIISELEESLDLVSEGAYTGRVNRRAVEHLLAKVLLTRGYEVYGNENDFSQAAAYADAAIAGESLSIPFGELWSPDNEMNSETIFSVQYSQSIISTDPEELGNMQSYFFGSYLGGPEVAGSAPSRSYNLIATDYTIDLYEEGDDRWEGTFMTEIFENYYDFYNVQEKDHDELSVSDYYAPKWKSSVKDSISYVIAHPGAVYHKYGTYGANINVNADAESISARKFDDPDQQFSNKGTSTRDIVLSRLGETYLIASEAYYKSGNLGTALARLNEVRNRANVAALSEIDIDVILDERARELFGEYHRWFDLKRTGTLVERTAKYNSQVNESYFSGNAGNLKILRPIPQSAIDLNQNPEFSQNPAYN